MFSDMNPLAAADLKVEKLKALEADLAWHVISQANVESIDGNRYRRLSANPLMMVVAARQLLADIVTIDGSQTRETSTPMPRLLGPTNYSAGDAVPVQGYNLARDDIHTSEPAFVSGLFDIAPALEAAAVPRFGAAASAPAAAPAAPIDVNAFAAAVAKAATAAATTSATGAKTGNDDLLREAFTAQQIEAQAEREQRANTDRAKNAAVQGGSKVDNEHYHLLEQRACSQRINTKKKS